jgi:putative FmdB family regulatory protein
MPTYQYKCPQCGYEFEEFQRMTDPPIEVCPACKGQTHRLVSGGAGFLFKGSGFYITDYRSSSYKEAAKKESSEHMMKSSTSSVESKKETSRSASQKND